MIFFVFFLVNANVTLFGLEMYLFWDANFKLKMGSFCLHLLREKCDKKLRAIFEDIIANELSSQHEIFTLK